MGGARASLSTRSPAAVAAWCLAALAVTPLLAAPAQAAGTRHRPRPTISAALPTGPAGPALSISVTGGRTSATTGDRLTYAVRLTNAGAKRSSPLAVTLTLPAYLAVVSASGHAAARAGQVSWHATVPAGRSVSYRAVTVLHRPPASVDRLAVVACADTGTKPVVCAAHLDRLAGRPAQAGTTARPGHPAGPVAWPALAVALVLITAVAALATWLARRRPRGEGGLRGPA